MKVILTQDVKSLGKKNQMVNVNDGYAKNYLIPKGLVLEANKSSVNEMKIKESAQKNRKEIEIKAAEDLAEKINKVTVLMKAKAGENGKLFGSITTKDIAQKLKKEHNITIDKRKLILKESIKATGEKVIDVKVYPKISAKLTVKVIGE